MHHHETLVALEVHAGGEPGRVIVEGVGHVPGATMCEKMCHLRDHADGLRRCMLREPRGYPGLCCNVLLPPAHPDADAGFVIMEQSEHPAMSGSNTSPPRGSACRSHQRPPGSGHCSAIEGGNSR